ncbi:MAG: response regulator transcription factor [Trueperaceae bacterium]|nr:response regulator transcription factor [Trueperaceae bacterium]
MVEDHALMRNALRELVDDEADLSIVGAVSKPSEALEQIPQSGCDLVMIDLSLPEMSGLELTKRLRVEAPGVIILIVSGHDSKIHAKKALQVGASGYVMKDNPEQVLRAIHAVIAGETFIDTALRR